MTQTPPPRQLERSRLFDVHRAMPPVIVHNEGTRMATLARLLPSHEAASQAALWPMVHAAQRLGQPCIALAAVDNRGVVAAGAVRLRAGEPTVAVVGRHSEADLRLDDPTLSLRHVAVVAPPWKHNHAMRFRLVDLASALGLDAPDDAPVSWIEGAGTVQATCAGYRLVAMGITPQPGGFDTGFDDTTVQNAKPPRRGPDCEAVANLHVMSDFVVEMITPYPAEELDAGIVLGRYGRALGVLPRAEVQRLDDQMSRIHALIMRLDDDVWLLDLASTNGTWLDGREVRAARLPPDRASNILLGRTHIGWHPWSKPRGLDWGCG